MPRSMFVVYAGARRLYHAATFVSPVPPMILRLKPLLCRLLALLLLVNGAVVAAEVSAHGLCDHGHGEGAALHLHDNADANHAHAADESRGDCDHPHDSSGEHLCHAHPPLCAAAAVALPPIAAIPTTRFAALSEALHSRRLSPPVPPPNA